MTSDEILPGHRPVRIWADGCFDMMHYGHANALRQAKQLGDILVVGVHSDAEIEKNKGPTVMKENERYAAVRSITWVDEVVENAPYVIDSRVLDQHSIDYVVHGEDITTDAQGNDVYDAVKRSGRYKEIRRTQGVSTTDIIFRMLRMTDPDSSPEIKPRMESLSDMMKDDATTPNSEMSPLPTTRMLRQFSEQCRSLPRPNDVVVYIDGAFDVFHPGHAKALEAAKAMGDYLIVGVHSDDDVATLKGPSMPILTMCERVLSVLSCRAVDEVVMGAPLIVSNAMVQHLHVDVVAHGTTSDYKDFNSEFDPYVHARRKGIYREFVSPFPDLTTSSIISRIKENRLKYEKRNKLKEIASEWQQSLEDEERPKPKS